jgi:alpha/beta superfamily hydrolase
MDLDVALFDFRAHGDSAGHFSTLGLREADDLKAVCARLKTHHPNR